MQIRDVNVLVTGAAGSIGRVILPDLRAHWRVRAFDRQLLPGDPDAVVGDLRDLDVLRHAMTGIDVLVHLAADPNEEKPFETPLPHNVLGLANAFQAAQEAGVRRIIFASSVQTVLCYPAGTPVTPADPPRPYTLYGAAKVFGEAAGRYYYDRFGIEFVSVRIGLFVDYHHPMLKDKGNQHIWLSPRRLYPFPLRRRLSHRRVRHRLRHLARGTGNLQPH